jgi:chorismate lyase / 3-hydroxybenzoate synthase
MIDTAEATRCRLPDPALLGLMRLAGDGGAFVDAEGWRVGGVDVDEAEAGGDLTRAAELAYERVFALLRETGGPPLLRLWNYLPRINEEAGGALERYRQFNIGRQAAFVAAGERAFEGAPAACALGKRGGPLSVRYLAGPARALALENPRQVPAWAYSRRWGPKSPTFSRAVLADAGAGRIALLISGTASIVGEATVHEGDLAAQVGETLANLRALLGAAEARSSARFALDELALTVYLRRAADLAGVQALLHAAAPRAAARAEVFEADICRRELLVEIEAHALAPGTLR